MFKVRKVLLVVRARMNDENCSERLLRCKFFFTGREKIYKMIQEEIHNKHNISVV